MDTDSVTIRRLDTDDVKTFRQIRLEALREAPSAFASRLEDWQALSDDDWRQRLSNPVFVAFLGRRPVRLMGILPRIPAKMAHRAELVMVYVQAQLCGAGIALLLLDEVVAYAGQHGILQLELSVNARNEPAIRFYRRFGFIEVGRIPGGIREEDMEFDDVIMVYRLIEQRRRKVSIQSPP